MSLSAAESQNQAQSPEKHTEAGRRGEDIALTHLLRLGYVLRERNYRLGRRGELDLVMEAPDGDLVFVEVKTSRQDRAGDPLEWVTPRKQAQIRRVAIGYCAERGIGERAMRFDVVGVELKFAGEPEVRHIPHAFLPWGTGYWR